MHTVSFLLVLLALGPNWSAGQQVDLQFNITTKLNKETYYYLTKDSANFYLDSYINDCLSQIEYCENGFTLAFNLSLFWSSQVSSADVYDSSYFNGRRVLASSGGESESSFTSGGFYLHEVNVRGDQYFQLGVRSFDKLFVKNVSHFFFGASLNL